MYAYLQRHPSLVLLFLLAALHVAEAFGLVLTAKQQDALTVFALICVAIAFEVDPSDIRAGMVDRANLGLPKP